MKPVIKSDVYLDLCGFTVILDTEELSEKSITLLQSYINSSKFQSIIIKIYICRTIINAVDTVCYYLLKVY